MFSVGYLSSQANPQKKRFKFARVELRDIIDIIRSVKASKDAGIDDIPARLVKDGAEELAAPLTIMKN